MGVYSFVQLEFSVLLSREGRVNMYLASFVGGDEGRIQQCKTMIIRKGKEYLTIIAEHISTAGTENFTPLPSKSSPRIGVNCSRSGTFFKTLSRTVQKVLFFLIA